MSISSRDVLRHIETEIRKVRGPTKLTSRYLNIVCPFHKDSDPSLGIRIAHPTKGAELGSITCFGCKKKGSWNDLAAKLGLKPIKGKIVEDSIDFRDEDFDHLLGTGRATLDDLKRMCHVTVSIPWDPQLDWRGTPGKVVHRLGGHMAFYTDKRGRARECLFMPVTLEGEYVGAFTARLKKDENKKLPSYLNMSGEWSKTHGLWPFDAVQTMLERTGLNYVVLVEGPRDALRLILAGVPALCCFGTSSVTRQKLKIAASLPIDVLWAMGDGDKAGHLFNDTIKKLAGSITKTRVARIPITEDRYDPCSMPAAMLKRLKRALNSG